MWALQRFRSVEQWDWCLQRWERNLVGSHIIQQREVAAYPTYHSASGDRLDSCIPDLRERQFQEMHANLAKELQGRRLHIPTRNEQTGNLAKVFHLMVSCSLFPQRRPAPIRFS